jgi:hypothetical protein
MGELSQDLEELYDESETYMTPAATVLYCDVLYYTTPIHTVLHWDSPIWIVQPSLCHHTPVPPFALFCTVECTIA